MNHLKNIILFIALVLTSSSQAEEIPKELLKLNLSSIQIENKDYLAASFKNFSKWHTYWINPGDAGLPISAKFEIDGKEIKLNTLEWPIPKKYLEKGDIQTFGYENDYTLFFDHPKSNEKFPFKAHFKWLICKHVCIPGEKILSGTISSTGLVIANNDFQIESSEISTRFNQLPKKKEVPAYLDINLVKHGEGLALIYNIKGEGIEVQKGSNILTPYTQAPFAFKRESIFKDKKGNIFTRQTIEWDGEYMDPEIPLPSDGKFKSPYTLKFLFADPISKESYIIEKKFPTFSLDKDKNFDNFFAILTKVKNDGTKKDGEDGKKAEDKVSAATEKASTSSQGLLYFSLMAFLGGLILNIMPCVLPVISLKLFGIIRHSGEGKKSIMKHNLTYSLGVMVTFLALATIVTALKTTGEQVGWGFQLQSPIFVAIMILVIFVMALNLFGLFEFRTPGGSKLGSVEIRNTFTGDFLSGVLATILSTPCSAPFLGTALTFAFSESLTTIFSIFFFIGLGLSFPFILTAFFPNLIKFLPRPGMWMEHVKKFLGLTLILTTLWLLDVFAALTNSQMALLKINTSLALVFFIFYMRSKISKNIVLTILFLIPTLLLYAQASTTKPMEGTMGSNLIQDKKRSGLNWQPWSEDKMKELQNSKQLTFIDFTAKWCITCKVNEKLVLDTNSFEKLVADKNINLLLADWTRRDPVIGRWLKSQGFVGVPAYFVINSDGELIKLGETISISELKKVLQ